MTTPTSRTVSASLTGRCARTASPTVRTPTARSASRDALRHGTLGEIRRRHAHLRRLGEPTLGLRHRADLAAESDLAENTASRGSARSYTLDASAAATARSPAGSCSRTPPTTLRKTSSCANESPARLSSTASSSARRRAVESGRDALRRAEARLGRERLDLDEHRARAFDQRRDRAARGVHAAVAEEQLGRILDGIEPASVMRNTPISSTLPKRFFVARSTR